MLFEVSYFSGIYGGKGRHGTRNLLRGQRVFGGPKFSSCFPGVWFSGVIPVFKRRDFIRYSMVRFGQTFCAYRIAFLYGARRAVFDQTFYLCCYGAFFFWTFRVEEEDEEEEEEEEEEEKEEEEAEEEEQEKKEKKKLLGNSKVVRGPKGLRRVGSFPGVSRASVSFF